MEANIWLATESVMLSSHSVAMVNALFIEISNKDFYGGTEKSKFCEFSFHLLFCYEKSNIWLQEDKVGFLNLWGQYYDIISQSDICFSLFFM